MSRAKTILLLAIFLTVLAACKPEVVPSALTASLSELQGLVDIRPTGEGDFAPATTESVLGVNGQIQTGDDGRVRLDLSSGTILRVAPSSLFTLASNEEVEGGLATKIKLELGQVFIILNGGSAEVETPSGVATVRGSILEVLVDPVTGDVYVLCAEGDCTAGNGAGTVHFTAGQKTILYFSATGEWTLPILEDMTPEEIQNFLDNNPELLEVINELFNQQNPPPAPPPPPPPAPPPPGDGDGNGGDTCFSIIQPPPGSELPHQGRVTFEWEAQPSASYYVITFTDANGVSFSFETTETEISKYIEIMPDAGEYSWGVTAYNEDETEICSAESAAFSKPDSNWEGKKQRNDEPRPYCDPCEYLGPCYDPFNPMCDQPG